MKTSIEMSDLLYKSAKELTQCSRKMLLALIEERLPSVTCGLHVKGKPAFKLKKASVGGKTVLKPAPADRQQLEVQHVCDRVFAQKAKHRKP